MLLASLILAAAPLRPAAGTHSQHMRVNASVEVTRPCKASVGDEERRIQLSGDCDDRDDRNEQMAPQSQFTGDQDNRRIYRIDRDDATGVTTILF